LPCGPLTAIEKLTRAAPAPSDFVAAAATGSSESALLVPPVTPVVVAVAVPVVTPAIGEGGLAAYREHASEDVLGARWRDLIQSLL